MEFHIRCDPKDIARYAFVPGSHDRAKKIAAHLNDVRLVSDSRGYLVYTGTVDGIRMTVSSTGMGGPSTAICIEELGHMGVGTFIRVGSSGTMQDYVDCGDVIISTGTYRDGGTANNYLPIEFPAVPNFDVTTALVQAARHLGLKAHVGLGSAGDSFYAPRDPSRRDLLKQAGIVSGEMESDTLYVVAALRGWRAGALYANDGTSKETKPAWGEEAFKQGEENAILIAIEAMKAIALSDTAKAG
ncbi:MAG: nucleoside phosphorylase [Chloroflexi bacterium]|nr:nucleoside phosphorylase [Chloroflexota bacterium]